jgi:hypothetical protein
MWGDNGSECSKYSILPTLFFISEHVKGNTDMEAIKKNFEKMFGISFDDFMLLDKPNEVAMPENTAFPVTPCKYMLYADPFVGFLDSTVKLGEGKRYAEYSEQLKAVAKKTRTYGYLFNNMAKLCDVLADKYELGVRTRAAYQAGDKEELLRLAKEEYTRAETNLKAFIKGFEKQWMKENKPYGFEVQHQRLGGQHARLGACKARLTDYAKGRLDSNPELEEKILTFRKDEESIYYNDYARTCTPCPSHPA